MTRHEFLFYTLITKTFVDKKALTAACATSVGITKYVSLEVERGNITEVEIASKGYRREDKKRILEKKIKCLTLTHQGYDRAVKVLKKVVPWFGFLPDKLSEFPLAKMRIENLERYASRISAAAVMADLIGAEECVPFISSPVNKKSSDDKDAETDNSTEDSAVNIYDDNPWQFDFDDEQSELDEQENVPSWFVDDLLDDEENADSTNYIVTMPDIIRNTIQNYYNFSRKNMSNTMHFIPSSDIKYFLSEEKQSDDSEIIDYRSGRYAGLVYYPPMEKVCVVYTATNTHPLLGRKTTAVREQQAILHYMSKQAPMLVPYMEKKFAILHVASPTVFMNSYHAAPPKQKDKTRRAYIKHPILSAGYDKFWVVPETHEGVKEYHNIMTLNLDQEEQQLLSALKMSSDFALNIEDKKLFTDFPLITPDGIYTAILPHLECASLAKKEAATKSKEAKQKSFLFLCRPWMIPYIQPIFKDNVRVESIDIYLPDELKSAPVAPERIYELATESENKLLRSIAP